MIIFSTVSGHVETVCLLSKKNAKPKDCVEISVMLREKSLDTIGRIITGSRVQRKTFDRLLKFEEYVKKPVE